MQTSFSRIAYRRRFVWEFRIFPVLSHAVSHIRIRQQSQAYGSPFTCTKLHRDVIKTGILGISFQSTVTELILLK